MRGLNRRLEKAKCNCDNELPHVLWAYHTTPHSTIGETPFRLTYRVEVFILVEIEELSKRIANPLPAENNELTIR